MSKPSEQSGFGVVAFYSLPVITTAWLMAPIGVIQGIYAKYYGFELTTIATIVLVARLFDAITDPLIGYYSDRHKEKNGSRKTFILTGALLFIVSSYFLYVPPDVVTVTYFTVWYMIFYLSYTLFDIPHIAWGNEFDHDIEKRTKNFSFRSAAGYFGLMLFYLVPLSPFFETDSITPETLNYTVLVAAVLMIPFLWACLRKVPSGEVFLSAGVSGKGSIGFSKAYTTIFKSSPFKLFLVFMLFFNVSIGMWYALIFIYVDAYLGLGELFSKVFLLAFLVGILATPGWYFLVTRLGKKIPFCLAVCFLIVSFIYTGTMNPGETTFLDLILVKCIGTLGISCSGILVYSLLGDIASYGCWKFGGSSNATYLSLYVFFAKASVAVSTASALGIAGVYGFNAADTLHSGNSILGIKLAISWIPSLLMLASLYCLYRLPAVSVRSQCILQRRLEVLELRAKCSLSAVEKTTPVASCS